MRTIGEILGLHGGGSGVLIGMVHVGALPGTPSASQSIDDLVGHACVEAQTLKQAGFDAVILENMHDTPYVHGDLLGPEIVACMTRVASEVARAAALPLGLQILSGGNRHAIAVAHAVGAKMIRCENFVFSHVADEGLLADAEAGPLLRYRRSIGASDVAVIADIKKKHASHAITGDVPIDEAARAAAFFGADGLVVTGMRTGHAAEIDDLSKVSAASGLPLLVGSGVDPTNVREMLSVADGVVVGSAIKAGGDWRGAVDSARCDALVAAARR